MKILIVPMSAMAETAGPISRCRLMAEKLKRADVEVATCIAKDINYIKIEGTKNYDLDIPTPLSLPRFIADKTFPAAQKLGITAHKTVNSFDEVLRLTGNLNYRYLRKSFEQISAAIDTFDPDIVYSEFNISAIIAAKYKGVRLYTTVSYPTQHGYAHDTKPAIGLNRLLAELSMDRMESALQLFEMADKRFCPSIKELEPFYGNDIIFCGALKEVDVKNRVRDKILVYMGNGTISATKVAKVIKKAFAGTEYEVFLASSYLDEENIGNLHIAHRWDFDALLDETVLYINHGGQNSVVDGLLHGVPQIVIPGKVFERRFNARKIEENMAGICLSSDEFAPEKLSITAEEIIKNAKMRENAQNLGLKLKECGGVEKIVKEML